MGQTQTVNAAKGARKLSSAERQRRWSRNIVDRKAASALSRDERWRRRGGEFKLLHMVLGLCAITLLAGAGGAALALFNRGAIPEVHPSTTLTPLQKHAFELFPEAVPYIGTQSALENGGQSLTLLLPAYLLESSAASVDPVERLAAEFKGAQRRLKGPEVARRIDALRRAAPVDVKLSCATHHIGSSKMIERDNGKPLRVRQIQIDLLPAC